MDVDDDVGKALPVAIPEKKPKRARSAYIMWTQEFRQNNTDATLRPHEVMAQAASQWKVMNEAEREPYTEKAQEERARVEAAMKAWKERYPELAKTTYKKQGGLSGKREKRSAYSLFEDEYRKNHAEKGKTKRLLVQDAADRWREMTLDERKPYQDQARELMAKEREKKKQLKPAKEPKKKTAKRIKTEAVKVEQMVMDDAMAAPVKKVRVDDEEQDLATLLKTADGEGFWSDDEMFVAGEPVVTPVKMEPVKLEPVKMESDVTVKLEPLFADDAFYGVDDSWF